MQTQCTQLAEEYILMQVYVSGTTVVDVYGKLIKKDVTGLTFEQGNYSDSAAVKREPQGNFKQQTVQIL